ncbi:MAG TPA: hypothetical protein VF753_19025 [Terriglobales bacterium]
MAEIISALCLAIFPNPDKQYAAEFAQLSRLTTSSSAIIRFATRASTPLLWQSENSSSVTAVTHE